MFYQDNETIHTKNGSSKWFLYNCITEITCPSVFQDSKRNENVWSLLVAVVHPNGGQIAQF